MSEDILHRIRQRTQNHGLDFTEQIYNEEIIIIEDLYFSIYGKLLLELGMTASNYFINAQFYGKLLREQSGNIYDLQLFVQGNTAKSLPVQKLAFHTTKQAGANESRELYFLDTPDGTEITFLISLNLTTIRSNI